MDLLKVSLGAILGELAYEDHCIGCEVWRVVGNEGCNKSILLNCAGLERVVCAWGKNASNRPISIEFWKGPYSIHLGNIMERGSITLLGGTMNMCCTFTIGNMVYLNSNVTPWREWNYRRKFIYVKDRYLYKLSLKGKIFCSGNSMALGSAII